MGAASMARFMHSLLTFNVMTDCGILINLDSKLTD